MFSFTSKEADSFRRIIGRVQRKNRFIETVTVDTMKWILELDYHYYDEDFVIFLEFERYEIAQELVDSGHIHLTSEMLQIALEARSAPAVRWLGRNGCPQEGTATMPVWLLCDIINENPQE